MSEDSDDSQKTEEPSQKRLDDARDKGDVFRAQEIKHAVMLGASALVIGLFAVSASNALIPMMVMLLGSADQIRTDGASLHVLTREILMATGLAVALPLALLLAAGIISGFAGGTVTIAAERIRPKWSKISPLAGLQRLVSVHNLVEFLKNLVKLAIVGSVCMLVLWPEHDLLLASLDLPLPDLLKRIMALSLKLLMAVAIAVAVLSLADFFYQYMSHRKKLRMSFQELRDEHKQSEGDPMIKARIRQIRMQRSRKRMMAAVPEADVVITNPTHFAVALKYDPDKMAAPRCVAKGVDTLALRIRALAEQHKVTIVENPPLARALYATVDIDQDVPPEQYKAVAEVISYVFRLRGKLPRRKL
jgi:flagellar biosynthesis protein FlhB